MKRLITACILLLVWACLAAAQTFTVAQWNLQHGQGTDNSFNPSRQVTALAGVDLAAVEERSTGETGWDTPLSSAGMVQAVYRENHPDQGDGPAIWYRTATVTLLDTKQTDLQTGTLVGLGGVVVNKAAVAAKVRISGRDFWFVATHLCWSACADSAGSQFSAQREGQITTLLNWINANLTGGLDIIIAGDMNFGPDYPKNGGGLIKSMFTTGYTDLWNSGLASAKATVAWNDRDGVGGADMPLGDLTTRTHDTRRIDYIFLKNGSAITLQSITVPDNRATCPHGLVAGGALPSCSPEVVGGPGVSDQQWDIEDDFGVRPSDHNMVKAVLSLGNCQPPNYCANTTLSPVTMPTQTVPVLNGSFVDTVANKTVVRATSATWLAGLDTAYNNQRFQVTSSSEQNTWSKSFTAGGHTHYRYSGVERTEGGTTHFIDWDGNTLTGSLINGWGNAAWPTATNFPGASGGTWSYTNDGYFYAHDNTTNTTLQKYDFNAKTITTIKDWSTGCGVTVSGGHLGEPTVDVTDTYFSTYAGGTAQDLDDHVVVWKAGVGGGCRWLNTQTGVVGGAWGPTGAVALKNSDGTSGGAFTAYLLHNARLSPDGNYLRMTSSTSQIIYVWDVNTTDLKQCVGLTDKCFGHMGWAWTKIINQENGGADAFSYATRSYADMSVAGLTYVAQPTIVPAENLNDSHLSSAFSNAQNSTLISCGAAYRSDGSPPNGNTPYQRTHRPYDVEVFCMTLNAGTNAPVYRMTHTFSTARYPATEVTCSSVSRSGSTVSATCTGHGLANGDIAIFTHTASNALDGFCGKGLGGVTVTGANTFTCTDESSGTIAATTARVSNYVNQSAVWESLPRGNMSQDGRFYAFASDFMGQLGNTAGGACAVGTTCRDDVFIVEMAPAATTTTRKCKWSQSPVCQ